MNKKYQRGTKQNRYEDNCWSNDVCKQYSVEQILVILDLEDVIMSEGRKLLKKSKILFEINPNS